MDSEDVVVPSRERFEALVFRSGEDGCDLDMAGSKGKDGVDVFRWMLDPCPLEVFMEECWDQRPLLVQREKLEGYYGGIFDMIELDRLLRDVGLMYGLNIDVTSYKDGTRNNHNQNEDGSVDRADPELVWKRFKEGSSLRILHPQRWTDPVLDLLSSLEGYWSCGVGSNVYLTPPGSQGFAPHYDDIDAFILQLEGRKRWKVYTPPTESEVLARDSSLDFQESMLGDPILEVELCAGDLLYLPRGIVHQASCLEDVHSLHLTVSCNQHNTFADLLELVLPRALEISIEEDLELRRSLPPGYLDYMGVIHSDNTTSGARLDFIGHVEGLVKRVLQNLPLDAAVDQMACRFIRQRLPTRRDASPAKKTINMKSRVVLVGKDMARLVIEEGSAILVHATKNSRSMHMEGGEEQEDEGTIEFDLDDAIILEGLLEAFPEPVRLQDIDAEKVDVLRVANALVDSGVLLPMC